MGSTPGYQHVGVHEHGRSILVAEMGPSTSQLAGTFSFAARHSALAFEVVRQKCLSTRGSDASVFVWTVRSITHCLGVIAQNPTMGRTRVFSVRAKAFLFGLKSIGPKRA